MEWEKTYKQKLVSAEEAASVIKSNDRIFATNTASLPIEVLVALGKRYLELENVELFAALSFYPFEFFQPDSKGHINYTTYFMGSVERMHYPQGNINILSHQFSKADWVARNRIKANVFIAEVSPPDENGNMSFGPTGTYIGKTVAENAEIIIAQVNQQTPYVYGDERAFLNVNEVTYISEVDRDLPVLTQPPVTEKEKRIASHIIPFIEDGSTIQIGLGGVANAVGFSLEHHKDLGVHTEMLVDSIVMLAEKGVINGSKKTLHKGEITTGFGFGTKKLYDFMHKNDMVKSYPQSYVNNPNIIAQHDNFISINSCLASDLTGQIGSESLGFNQFSCTGGQLDFVRGSALSKGGKSFLCMNSTAQLKDGTMVSRISAALPAGTVVTTPRTDVQYVVTEYGIADLRDRSIRERVEAMINIAHPDFRDQLLKEAKENRIIF